MSQDNRSWDSNRRSGTNSYEINQKNKKCATKQKDSKWESIPSFCSQTNNPNTCSQDWLRRTIPLQNIKFWGKLNLIQYVAHPTDNPSSQSNEKDAKSIQQVISSLQGADRYKKSNIISMLQVGNMPLVSQSVKKRNKNEDGIKKEKKEDFISKRLDSIFEVCRAVPTTVKKILLGKGYLPSDFKCVFFKDR